jgi:penicillin amidase
MPHLADPERGWIATANNRPAPEDFPYPLSGTWSDGLRAKRIREMFEEGGTLTPDRFAAMQQDVKSLRAGRCLDALVRVLVLSREARHQQVVDLLRSWDGRMEADRVGAAIFEVFFFHWAREVVAERVQGDTAAFLAGAANGVSTALLVGDNVGWFAPGKREQAILTAMTKALDWLTARLGPDMSEWKWGRLHVLSLRHVLSGRGDLGQLLNHGGKPVGGNAHTVCNTGLGRDFEAGPGATYRLIADLATSPPELRAVDSQSESGHPGSPHYGDQLETWLSGGYHRLSLARGTSTEAAVHRLTLEPSS